MSGLTRYGIAEPSSRDFVFRRERGEGRRIFRVQLTTSRISNHCLLKPNPLNILTTLTRKTRCPPNDAVPRGEQGTRDGGEETRTETGTGMRTRTEISTRAGMGARIEMRVERRENPGSYEVVIEVDRRTQGGPEATPTSNQQPQPQDPMPQRDRRIMRRTRAQGREAKEEIGEGRGEAKKRKKPQRSCRRVVGNVLDLGGRRKTRR